MENVKFEELDSNQLLINEVGIVYFAGELTESSLMTKKWYIAISLVEDGCISSGIEVIMPKPEKVEPFNCEKCRYFKGFENKCFDGFAANKSLACPAFQKATFSELLKFRANVLEAVKR